MGPRIRPQTHRSAARLRQYGRCRRRPRLRRGAWLGRPKDCVFRHCRRLHRCAVVPASGATANCARNHCHADWRLDAVVTVKNERTCGRTWAALPGAPLALGETVPAVDRAVAAGLKRHFTFPAAICTGGFVHLARTSKPATTPTTTRTCTERHVSPSVPFPSHGTAAPAGPVILAIITEGQYKRYFNYCAVS
jgi:hypothetical protein